MKIIALLSLAAFAAAATASPAVAAGPETLTSIVQTADLDLASPAGQHKLQLRIVHAASEVCGTASDADLVGQNAVRQCRKDTIAKAAEQREQLLAAARRGSAIRVAAAR